MADGTLRGAPYARVEGTLHRETAERAAVGAVDARPAMLERWQENQVWPLPVLADLHDRDRLARDLVYVTDSRDASRFDPPRTWDALRSPAYAYFAGVAAGDGGFNGPNIWSVVDGGRPHELDDSRTFIDGIATLLRTTFGIPDRSLCTVERGNAIHLKVANKWFCRFIRYAFDLPVSYKKGELRKSSLFRDRTTSRAFWRGVFDTDGSISRDSYRVSVCSATEEFIDDCRADLEADGITRYTVRESNGYDLRLDPAMFEKFATTIGFAHPRKKRMLLETLRDGARNYTYRGRDTGSIFNGTFYDLTAIDGLRVLGMGDQLRDHREAHDLYQRELADDLDASTNQVHYWETGRYAMPLDVLATIMGSARAALELLADHGPRFKVGVRGNANSPVHLPVETSRDIDGIAADVVATGNELRVLERDDATADRLEDVFDTAVERGETKYRARNHTVVAFFRTCYRYEPTFPAYDEDDLADLAERLDIPASPSRPSSGNPGQDRASMAACPSG